LSPLQQLGQLPAESLVQSGLTNEKKVLTKFRNSFIDLALWLFFATQILANLFASMPIRDAKVASRVLGKTVEASAERFVINFLPEREQAAPSSSWFGLSLLSLRVLDSSFAPPNVRRLAPSTPNMGSTGHGRNYARSNVQPEIICALGD